MDVMNYPENIIPLSIGFTILIIFFMWFTIWMDYRAGYINRSLLVPIIITMTLIAGMSFFILVFLGIAPVLVDLLLVLIFGMP
jgi:hypothetical protein